MFSNEAGLGTTPSIAGMQETNNINKQGYFQMLGVYIDTLLLCTLTGIFVVQTMMSKNIDLTNFQGPDLIIYLMNIYFDHVGVFLGIFFLICFAFSSVLGEFYLGESNLLFISNNKFFKLFYRFMFSIMLIFGVFFTTEQAMNLVDLGIIILGIINLTVILLLLKKDKWKLKM
jgi:AGCS family alanine or glycine:cation symporter